MKTSKYKIALVYWVVYVVFICFYEYYSTIDQYRNSEKKQAEVVDRLIAQGRKRGWYYYPQLKFVYNDSAYLFGESHGFFPSRYRIGNKVTVIFPKGEPEKAEIYSFLPYWISLTKLFFSFMIALFLFMTVIFTGWYNDFKRKQQGITKNVRR